MDNIHCYFGLALDSIVFGLILRDYYRLRKFTKSVKESKDLELKSLTQDDSKRYCAIRGTVRPIGLPLSSCKYFLIVSRGNFTLI